MIQGTNNSFLKLDISNAFNSIPFVLIKASLKQLRLHEDHINYIMAMLEHRHPDVDVNFEAGVPQGDPLSMLLFVVAINPII